MPLTPQKIEYGFEKLYQPFQSFISNQITLSVLLIVCVILALVVANSPYADHYEAFKAIPIGLSWGEAKFEMSLQLWVNEAFMTYFFFLLGLEVKRELLVGEIRTLQRLAPIAFAALGGILFPASIYYALNLSSGYGHGWGIPVATDTALAVGILALLGKGIPSAAFVFLTALAIIDDLGAILVIALFYSNDISLPYLAVAAAMTLVLTAMNLAGIRRPSAYLLAGIVLWVALHGSGLHSTLAGIIVAAAVPARGKRDPKWLVEKGRKLLFRFERLHRQNKEINQILEDQEQHEVVEYLQKAAEKTSTPLRRWEKVLETPVALFILPLFALTNAGVAIDTESLTSVWLHPLGAGVIFGLVIGKAVGIPLFCWLTMQLKLGVLPDGLSLRHVVGIGMLGGVGFTMSIFISSLGFSEDPDALLVAKTAVLLASFLAGTLGYLWLKQQPATNGSEC